MPLDLRVVAIALLFCFFHVTNQAFAQLSGNGKVVTTSQLCRLIGNEARKNGLPPAYFARLIRTESGFDPDAVSPDGGQGIAQFSPERSLKRKLDDPFDPRQAIPAAAEYLAYLRVKFGNLGLATAAYDGGEAHVDQWLAGKAALTPETQAYVEAITGEVVGSFRQRRHTIRDEPLKPGTSFNRACLSLAAGPVDDSMYQGLQNPWLIQIAAHFRRDVVVRKWDDIRARHANRMGEHPVVIAEVKTTRGSNTMFAVRIGMDSRAEANIFCNELKAGGTACIVMKNRTQ